MNPNKQKKRRPWPEKHRKKLAAHARRAKPWKKSTGPKTDGGKQSVARNSLKHGLRSADIVRILRVLRCQKAFLRDILARQTSEFL